MNRNRCATKRIWANIRHCSGIFQEGLGNTTKNLPAGVGFEPETFRKQTGSRGQLKCDGTRAETRFRLSAKRTSPFKSAGASVQSTTTPCSEVVWRILATHSIRHFPLHFPSPCVTVCHYISTGVYQPPPLQGRCTSTRLQGVVP